MKITKFQHSCLIIEHESTTLVIDPGVLTHDFITPHKIDAVIITHEHPDHLDEKRVHSLLKSNPKAALIAHESISSRFNEHPTISAEIGQVYNIKNCALQFFGGSHAVVASHIPAIPNLGVLVNNQFYYPGDSFTVPKVENLRIDILALPISAPWSKISEVIEFLSAVKPNLAFPTHDGILSADGKQIFDNIINRYANTVGVRYERLDGLSIEA